MVNTAEDSVTVALRVCAPDMLPLAVSHGLAGYQTPKVAEYVHGISDPPSTLYVTVREPVSVVVPVIYIGTCPLTTVGLPAVPCTGATQAAVKVGGLFNVTLTVAVAVCASTVVAVTVITYEPFCIVVVSSEGDNIQVPAPLLTVHDTLAPLPELEPIWNSTFDMDDPVAVKEPFTGTDGPLIVPVVGADMLTETEVDVPVPESWS